MQKSKGLPCFLISAVAETKIAGTPRSAFTATLTSLPAGTSPHLSRSRKLRIAFPVRPSSYPPSGRFVFRKTVFGRKTSIQRSWNFDTRSIVFSASILPSAFDSRGEAEENAATSAVADVLLNSQPAKALSATEQSLGGRLLFFLEVQFYLLLTELVAFLPLIQLALAILKVITCTVEAIEEPLLNLLALNSAGHGLAESLPGTDWDFDLFKDHPINHPDASITADSAEAGGRLLQGLETEGVLQSVIGPDEPIPITDSSLREIMAQKNGMTGLKVEQLAADPNVQKLMLKKGLGTSLKAEQLAADPNVQKILVKNSSVPKLDHTSSSSPTTSSSAEVAVVQKMSLKKAMAPSVKADQLANSLVRSEQLVTGKEQTVPITDSALREIMSKKLGSIGTIKDPTVLDKLLQKVETLKTSQFKDPALLDKVFQKANNFMQVIDNLENPDDMECPEALKAFRRGRKAALNAALHTLEADLRASYMVTANMTRQLYAPHCEFHLAGVVITGLDAYLEHVCRLRTLYDVSVSCMCLEELSAWAMPSSNGADDEYATRKFAVEAKWCLALQLYPAQGSNETLRVLVNGHTEYVVAVDAVLTREDAAVGVTTSKALIAAGEEFGVEGPRKGAAAVPRMYEFSSAVVRHVEHWDEAVPFADAAK